MKIIIGITGTSGAVLAKQAIDTLKKHHKVFVVASENGYRTFKEECGLELYDFMRRCKGVSLFSDDNLSSPICDDEFDANCMMILPCSSSTVGKIASGCGSTLLTKTADMMLKEKRKLVIGVRETPFSPILLNNLTLLSNCGAIINPLTLPCFKQESCADQIYKAVLDRVLRSAQIEIN